MGYPQVHFLLPASLECSFSLFISPRLLLFFFVVPEKLRPHSRPNAFEDLIMTGLRETKLRYSYNGS